MGVLKDLACEDKELSILFTDDEQIAQLNRQYLGKKGPTNVLAFPMKSGADPLFESSMLGDVVVSVDTALKESKELKESIEDTIDRLLLHGVLHLLGYDHEKSELEAERMKNEEKRLVLFLRKEIEDGKVSG